MSKLTKRKITVESSNSGSSGNLNSSSSKDSQRRQSVFERLGIKTSTPITINTALSGQAATTGETYCRHWAQNGTCPYGKSCKFTNTHTLISPSKRIIKKEQATLRALEEAKRLHSTVIKRSSPDVNWESWDQTDLEYEDEKVLEKRRQLLQRELELQMKREETENSTRKGIRPKHLLRKDATSSSSSSLTSTSSTDTTTSSDDSSSASSSTSGVGQSSKRRKGKAKKSKRDSTSSASDIDRISRKKIRDGKKGRSTSTLKKLTGLRRGGDSKKGSTPPLKGLGKASLSRARKKSTSPTNQRSSSTHRRHPHPTPATPPPPSSSALGFGSKTTKGSSKTGSSSRHAASPRSGSRRSVSVERKEKHNRSISPRGSNRDRERDRGRSRSPKLKNRDRSPALRRSGDTSRSRRKDSPDSKSRDKRVTRKNSPKRDRIDDRKKDDDRSRGGKDDRRFERKSIPDRSSAGDREKREHDDSTRNRDKAREIAREKERIEALERCRERQRERDQMAKEKDKQRDRVRDDRDKDISKSKDYDRDVPLHNVQGERKGGLVDRDRLNKERKERDKERERERPYERGMDKSGIEKPRLGPERMPDRDRNIDKIERERPSEKDRRGLERERGNERDHLLDRNRNDKPPESDRERGMERERVFERGPERDRIAAVDRGFDRDRDKERVKVAPEQRPRDRERPEFERERPHEKENRERQFERGNEHERSYERTLERDRSLEKDRNVVRDRGIERVMERERGSMDRGRGGSDSERRERERFERDSRYEQRRPIPNEDKGYESPFDGNGRRERGGRYSNEGVGDRAHYSPPREDPRNMRMQPQFGDDRRRRDPGMRNWDYDEGAKSRDWEYQDNRRDWDPRNRGMRRPPHPNEPVEGCEENIPENEPIEQAITPSGDISIKRAREESDGLGQEMKKIRTDEPPPPAILEEDLSDISDDPDEILNRDDIEVTGTEPEAEIDEMEPKSAHISPLTQSSLPQAPVSTANNSTLNDSLEQRLADDRAVDEEGVDNLDFEEISDEELEEEARANKGLGDALGVDWASLVAETRPKTEPTDGEPGAARRRWQPIRILSRIGISLKYAGEKIYNQIQEKTVEVVKAGEDGEEAEVKEPKAELQLLHPVAGIHSTLRLKHSQRRSLFSSVDIFKRALSARRDIAIRRHLCNLPVKSLEVQQAAGLCQWVV